MYQWKSEERKEEFERVVTNLRALTPSLEVIQGTAPIPLALNAVGMAIGFLDEVRKVSSPAAQYFRTYGLMFLLDAHRCWALSLLKADGAPENYSLTGDGTIVEVELEPA